ncbi:MAG: acyl-CoA dehydrogenase [Pseudohongiellaceae bacterium]
MVAITWRVATTATQDGDALLLNGEKVAVLNAPNADQLLVVARESGDERDREEFPVLVAADVEGVHINGFANIDGKKAGVVKLDNVKVSAADRLGDAGAALPVLEEVADLATIGVSAEAVGAMEALLQKTVEYSKTRKQFGVPIATFQALQHRMADMFIECQLARSIVIMAAMKLDSDADRTEKTRAVSAAKSRVSNAIHLVGQEAIQIHGGIGTTEELDVGHLFKRVTAIDVMFGDADYHSTRFASLSAG